MRIIEYPRLQERCAQVVLNNGLTIRVLPKPEFNKMYAVLAVNYGAVDTAFALDGQRIETPAGVAHYLEHQMFALPDGNAMQAFSALGGNPNAFTGYDMTAYYISATSRAEENLELLLRMVMTPYFPEENVEKERGIIAQEIRMYEDHAEAQVYERLFSVMFPDHPVRVSIAGSVESIGEITPQVLEQCYRAFYRPSNMILCVEGCLTPEQVVEIAERVTPAEAEPKPMHLRTEQRMLPPQRTEREMDVAMPMFSVGIRLPDAVSGDGRMAAAAELAAELVVGEASRCYCELYQRGLIDSGFYAGFESIRNLAMLTFGGDSDAPDRVAEAVFEEAKRLCNDGIDPEELKRLKKSLIGGKMRELDSFGGTCNRICGYFFEEEEYLEFREIYEAVTQEDIKRILALWSAERACMSVILPRTEKGE